MPLVSLTIPSSKIATITLNDPDRRNAMSSDMARAFAECVVELKSNNGLRAVVITGAGPSFAAGGDLNMLREKATLDEETNCQQMLEFYRAFLSILDLPVPTIAAVNGHAIGAGFCLALACEFRVIADSAKLGLNFTRIGLHPGMGATLLLPRIAGWAIANDLLLSGRVITASEAHGMGLTQSVVAADSVIRAATSMAESFLATGPDAVRGLLETLRPSQAELAAALQREAAEQARNYSSAEFAEGIDAAINRREPQF